MKRFFAIFLIVALFVFSSCQNKDQANDYIKEVAGEWSIDYNSPSRPNDLIVFHEDHTGSYYDGRSERLMTWSYDEKADVYLLYISGDAIAVYVSIVENDDDFTMKFGNYTGKKVG